MSLVQKSEGPQLLTAESIQVVAALGRAAVPVDFRDITRRPAQAAPITLIKLEANQAIPNQSEAAFDLINKVAGAVPMLVDRCEQLETALSEAKEVAKAELDTANDVAREWMQIAGALKLQVEGLEKGMKSMKQRAEEAEQLVTQLRESADRSQHAAAEAECLSSLFQDKVIASFGAGSPVYPLLESLRGRQAAAA